MLLRPGTSDQNPMNGETGCLPAVYDTHCDVCFQYLLLQP